MYPLEVHILFFSTVSSQSIKHVTQVFEFFILKTIRAQLFKSQLALLLRGKFLTHGFVPNLTESELNCRSGMNNFCRRKI